MLGFSLQKLIALGAIIALVWYGFKWLSRYQQVQKAKAKNKERLARATKPSPTSDREDLEACKRCGVFIPAGSTHECA